MARLHGTAVNLNRWFNHALWALVCVVYCAALAGCLGSATESDSQVHVSFRPAISDVATPVALPSECWASWRGGEKHGVSAAVRLPQVWSEGQGVRWKVEVPGRGNSSPVVWQDQVFLTSVIDGQAFVLSFDRTDGKVLWQQPVGEVSGPSHSKNGYASATIATNGEQVFATFSGLGLFAFDTKGNALWNVPLVHARHEWGLASSPVLYENLVIQLSDGDHPSALFAVDRLTGQEVWRAQRESRGAWCSPVVVTIGSGASQRAEIVVNGTGSVSGSQGEVIGYDPQSGHELWRARGTTDIPCPTLIVGEDVIVSTSGSNGPIFALRPGGQGDVTETRRLWRLPNGGAYVPTGVIYEDRLVLVSDGGVVTCHQLSDGAQLWRKRLHGAFSASLVAGGGNIYAVNERGDVYVFRASHRFELIATNRLQEACLATPAIAHGELYLRTARHLYCISEMNLAAADPDESPTTEELPIRSPADRKLETSRLLEASGTTLHSEP